MTDRKVWAIALGLAALPLFFGCARKPVLYPNAHYESVGKRQAEAAVAECGELAKAHGASPDPGRGAGAVASSAGGAATGAVGGSVAGAIGGNAGRGAARGAAGGAAVGLFRSLFFRRGEPSPAHRAFVERCLRDQGFDPIGWN